MKYATDELKARRQVALREVALLDAMTGSGFACLYEPIYDDIMAILGSELARIDAARAVKVESPASPWLPLAEAPKDGTPLVIRWLHSDYGVLAAVLFWNKARKSWVYTATKAWTDINDPNATFQPLSTFTPEPAASPARWLTKAEWPKEPMEGDRVAVRLGLLPFVYVWAFNDGAWCVEDAGRRGVNPSAIDGIRWYLPLPPLPKEGE